MPLSQFLRWSLLIFACLVACCAAAQSRVDNPPAQQLLTYAHDSKESYHLATKPNNGDSDIFLDQKSELLDLFSEPNPVVSGYSRLLDNPDLLVKWEGRVSKHFYIDKDESIMEGFWDPADYQWKPKSLPFKGDPHFPMLIAVSRPYSKKAALSGRPERIQLFFTDNETLELRSIIWTEIDGWYEDIAFRSLRISHFAGDIASWRDPTQNLTRIRLFTYKVMHDPRGDEIKLHNGTAYTAGSAIYEFSWAANRGWSASNDGEPIARSLSSIPIHPRSRCGAGPRMLPDLTLLIFCDKRFTSEDEAKLFEPDSKVANMTAEGVWEVLSKEEFWKAYQEERNRSQYSISLMLIYKERLSQSYVKT